MIEKIKVKFFKDGEFVSPDDFSDTELLNYPHRDNAILYKKINEIIDYINRNIDTNIDETNCPLCKHSNLEIVEYNRCLSLCKDCGVYIANE